MLFHLKNHIIYDNGNLNLYVMHILKYVYLTENSIPFIVPFIWKGYDVWFWSCIKIT